MPEEHFQAGRVPADGPQSADSAADQVVCPRCHRATEHLKVIDIPNVIFLVAYVAWNNETATGCPDCIRRLLRRRLLTSVPLSNILYPLPACFYVTQYFGTYVKGHSNAAIATAHRMTRTEMLAQQEAAINLNRPARREWIILALLILVIAGIWVGGLMWAPSTSPTIAGRTVQEWTDVLRRGQRHEKLEAMTVLSRGGDAARPAIPALRQIVLHDNDDAIVRQEAYHALNAIDPESTRGLPFPGFILPVDRD